MSIRLVSTSDHPKRMGTASPRIVTLRTMAINGFGYDRIGVQRIGVAIGSEVAIDRRFPNGFTERRIVAWV